MAQFARAVFFEDVLLETVGFHGLEGCQGPVGRSGRVVCFSGDWGWGWRWHRIRGAEQHIGGKFEFAVGTQEKILNALAPQNGFERQRAFEALKLVGKRKRK